jgi:alpha-2-macroglobulin
MPVTRHILRPWKGVVMNANRLSQRFARRHSGLPASFDFIATRAFRLPALLLLILLLFSSLNAGCRQAEVVTLLVEVTATPRPAASPTPLPATATTAAPTATATNRPPTPPRLTRRVPNFTTLTVLRPEIRLSFDRPMNGDSVLAALHTSPPIAFDYRRQGNDFYLTPQEALLPGRRYEFVLRPHAVDEQGTALGVEQRWHYETRPLLGDFSHPTERRANAPITVRFNYPMDETSVAEALAIKPAVPGTISWNSQKTILYFAPSDPWPVQNPFTVSFTGELQEMGGSWLPAPGPMTFITPPPILSSEPRGEAVHPASVIKVTFDRLVDTEQTGAAFRIEPAVSGTVEWQETTLIFRPTDASLEPHTTYTVTIGETAVDGEGQPLLRQAYSWSFRTGRAEPVASFGWGPNSQVLDAGGRRAIHFNLIGGQHNRPEPSHVTFELYRLNLAVFLDRYSSGFRGVTGWEQTTLSTAGSPLVTSWQVIPSRSPSQWNNIQEVIIPAEVAPGLYILNLVAGDLNDQLILVLSHNTLMVKQAEGQLVTWLTEINGGPVAGAEINVYARDGRRLDQGRSDANGLYRTQVPVDPQPLIVVARHGDDITVSGLSNEWSQGASPWGFWWQAAPAARKFAAHIYTDRPIYRPGQTIYYKAIVRRDDDARLSLLPEGTAVTVRIRDGRNNVVQTVNLATNHFGAVHGQFQLAEGAGLGEYTVEVVVEGESRRQAFKVEDYRKPDYQITVSANADQYVSGQQIQATVDSRYFFGEAVVDAEVTVNFFYLSERYWWESSSGDDPYVWHEAGRQPVRGRTDENGRFSFNLPATPGYSYDSYEWQSNLKQSILAIEASVDDGSHQVVSGLKTVRIYNAAERINLDFGSHFQQPGEAFTLRAQVHDLQERPVSGRQLTVSLRRFSYDTYRYDRSVQSASLTTGADGRANLPFTVNEPGYYQLFLSGRDSGGREISFTTGLYVFSQNVTGSWHGRGSDGLSIAAEQSEYAPGDSARLIIESTFSGPALLTFERGTTRREQLIELTAPITMLDVLVQADDVPNVFITVNAWQEQETTLGEYSWQTIPDSRLHVATTSLSVPATDRILNVTITPDKESYGPRQEATFTLRVTNYRGEPVSAELSLAMVDEAIFTLSRELSGPIYEGFYYARANVVRTYHSLAPVRDLGGGGMGGGGGNGLEGAPRSDFPDTAQWFPSLHTDANGEVVVTVTLPDSLTSWRLTAKATTADTQVGETFTHITTRQDVIVRPILPRVLTAGDRAHLSALVHNYGGQRQSVVVSLELAGDSYLTISTPISRTLSLAAGDVQVVGWPVTAVAAGEAQLLVRVVAGEKTLDAVQLPLWIRPLAVPDVTTQTGQFSGVFNTTIQVPDGALEMSSVRLELSRSIAGTLLEGLDYLTGFPYGCVEQTMSRALPNAVVARAFHQLGIGNPALQADLPPMISAGLQRLYGFQHNDGGWGWWYDDRTDAYQTAWVVFGLAVTAEAGYEVDDAVIERGAAWLRANLDAMDPRLRAYALYSLAVAGHGDREATLATAGEAPELDTFSQAALALALHKLGARAEAQQLVDLLADTAVVNNDGRVYWRTGSGGQYDQRVMASSTRSTAITLSAFSQIRPNHELVPGTVRWLMGERRSQGWGTTNETAYAVIGLTDHLLATSFSESATATTYNVFVNGQSVAGGSLGRGEPAVSLEIPLAQLQNGTNALRIEQSGSGRLYYTLNHRVYLAQSEIVAAGAIQVSRAYLDPATNRPVEQIAPGQLVRVQLVVTLPSAAAFMIVEDSLPGGLEALNENLNTSSHVGGAGADPVHRWRELGYNYKEVRGERVSFFITEMAGGRHTFTYMARATHSGAFTALPAQAWPMYDLATWGRSDSSMLQIGDPSQTAVAN